MKKELIASAKQRLGYLEEFLRRLAKAEDVIPEIQNIREQAKWEVERYESMPEEASEFFSPTTLDEYLAANEHMKKSIPMPPLYEIYPVSGTASITMSGTSDLYTYAYHASEVEDGDIADWGNVTIIQYRGLQEKQFRYEQVKNLLNEFNPKRIEDLESAYKAYKSAIADVGERTSAGISIRNLHEHFKGDLFEKARKWPKENMTWETMASRLARGGEGSAEHIKLQSENGSWQSLQSRLSEVVKGQQSGSATDLDDIWTRFLDYMFIVLGLIE